MSKFYSGKTRVLSRPDGDPSAPLVWKLETMAVDDVLVVPADVLPFGKVYAYVKMRGTQLDRFFKIERGDDVTIVTRAGSRSEARVRRMPKIDRPEDGDWGWITRAAGKHWHFPWAQMEPGDVFRVEPDEMKIGSLRNRAYTAAWKLGKHFSVLENPIKSPGSFLVECLAAKGMAADAVVYGTIRQKLMTCFEAVEPDYMFDPKLDDRRLFLDKVGFDQLVLGDRLSVKVKRVADPHRMSYVFEAWVMQEGDEEGRMGRFAIDLYDERIDIERVIDDMSINDWQKHKQLRLEKALS